MAMQTVQYKGHEGLGQLSSVLPWWGSAFGSEQAFGGSCSHSKPFTIEVSNSGNQVTATKTKRGSTDDHEQGGLDKGITNQFTIIPGDKEKPQPAIELGFSQPLICAKYPYMDQCYGLFSTSGSPFMGRVMLPLNSASDEGPIYVNAKQYHGIMRRRQSRAKAIIKSRAAKLRRPYMHESRHLHAMRRARGCGGRFLNTKNSNNEKGGNGNGRKQVTDIVQLFGNSGSQGSYEVPKTGTVNSSKTNRSGSNVSGSEDTSTYSRGELDRFAMNFHLGHSAHSLSDMMDGMHGMVMPTKWIAAADSCCNLNV